MRKSIRIFSPGGNRDKQSSIKGGMVQTSPDNHRPDKGKEGEQVTGTFLLDVEKVRLVALSRGLSIADLESEAGISRGVIRHATGGGGTTVKCINKLAAALDCNPCELVKG